MKRIFSIMLCAVLMLTTTACKETENTDTQNSLKDNVKIGVILSGDESDGYSYPHIRGIQGMLKNLGLSEQRVVYKYNISDNRHIYDTATELADEGCSVIFGTSQDFEEQMFRVADRYCDVHFCNTAGKGAKNSGLDNTHNYFAAVFQARYVSGIVAGMKLKEMLDGGLIDGNNAKIGYIGAYENAEVRSGYTAFFLGVRSIVPEAVMEVKYTGAWTGEEAEKDAARYLIENGSVIISKHTDTKGADSVCEESGVYFVGYNDSVMDAASMYALACVKVNWEAYYTYAVQSVIEKTAFDTDWCGTYKNGGVVTEINEKAIPEGTLQRVLEAEKAIRSGTLKIFDTSTFRVSGRTVTSTEGVEGYEGLEYIVDGEFAENMYSSAPAFNFVIDGIKETR